ncbi:MAG: hypothetical protein VB858_12010 [Planctomycetaceae bacterium]
MLLLSACLLLVAETSCARFVPAHGLTATFIWLLIPWFAVLLPGASGVIVATIYGLLADCLASGPPGVLAGICIAGTYLLQRALDGKSLRSFPRVVSICFVSSLFLSMLLTTVRLLLEPQQIDAKLLGLQLGTMALGGALLAGMASIPLRPLCGMHAPGKAV